MFGLGKNKRPTPSWVTWLMVSVVIFALISNRNEQSPVRHAVEQASENLAPEKLLPVESYRNILTSPRQALKLDDVTQGEGPPAICAQEAGIAYQAYRADGTPLDDRATAEKPFIFRIGEGKALPALDKSVIGMRVGSKRRAVAVAELAYDATGFSRDDVPKGETATFEIELLKLSPTLPGMADTPFRIIDARTGGGPIVLCGDPVRAHVTLWSVAGEKLFSTLGKEPLSFTPGKAQVFIGLEQGVIGMNGGGVRTLIVPPDFQKTMHGAPPAIEFPLPKDQTVLIDLESAY